MQSNHKSIIIIGAGFAGMAAGIYARLNGYNAGIFEMHTLPGGLCTSWRRQGFTFDGCIHWLVGSSPASGIHDIWEQTGISENRKFVDLDEYFRIEDNQGRTLIFYNDVDRLEKHLLDFSPADREPINEFIDGIRMCTHFQVPSKHDSFFRKIGKRLAIFRLFLMNGKKMKTWMNTTAEEFASKFTDPLLKEAFMQMWIPEFSMFFMLFTFAYLHNRNAGYPIGGSRPMSEAMEARFKQLGGTVKYNSRVTGIITSDGVAKGVRLENGQEFMADRIISAADGHSTIFNLLGGTYGDRNSRTPYEKWPLFPPLIFISYGINRSFSDVAKTVSGITFQLKEEVTICEEKRNWLQVHIFNQDPTLAPEGKTVMTVMLKTDYDYWKNLARDRMAYVEKKNEIASVLTGLLEQRFPGITEQVEVTDVATPLTFERYTGNWKGSFEGWLITPHNAGTIMKPMDQTIAGLKNFYMCGQWVEPGGGLPTSVMSAQRLIKRICKEDHLKFRTE
jgi:phytoene dehydrogenase-like protein